VICNFTPPYLKKIRRFTAKAKNSKVPLRTFTTLYTGISSVPNAFHRGSID